MNNSAVEQFRSGTFDRAYTLLGCRPCRKGGRDGIIFRVWAPRARAVSVVGDFNFWNTSDLPMKNTDGIWEVVSYFAAPGQRYQYFITRPDGTTVYKNDPYALSYAPLPDKVSLITFPSEFRWHDVAYYIEKKKRDPLTSPVNIYEFHLGSWERHEDGSFLNYRESADKLIPYVRKMGYTHVELLPVTEYPFEPSWGYQVTGFFAPTSRYGTPDDFRYFIDKCHAAGIGVILDWVSAHFPKDETGLYEFDGTPCYELADPEMNEHPDWNTRIFDYGRGEVRSFLISSALFWIREYHVDGIRVDAVASMLYLDYGRKHYKPNRFGGNQNLEAIDFLRCLNEKAFAADPQVMMIAEESTAFPMVTKPPFDGGLGFNFKWNMGWMNDILSYMSTDPLFRKGRHNELTFSLTYAFSENFILPFSHDEVVHGKCSMIGKMPGEYDDKFANLRTLAAYKMAHPGKKLTFMGNEFAQFIEWDFTKRLDWFLLDYEAHARFQAFERDLNRFYLSEPALWQRDFTWEGFRWISADDRDQSVIAFLRFGEGGEALLVIVNFCPVLRRDYRLGMPEGTVATPVFSGDRKRYGGTGTRLRSVKATGAPMHSFEASGKFTVPPLSATFYRLKKQDNLK